MIVIRGAQVYDPRNGIHGKVQDVWVEGEHIVSPPENPMSVQVLDGTGCFIAPGAVEIHTHVAGYGLNAARKFMMGNRVAADALLPPARTAAERYLKLGYTTVMDAAASPLFSRSTHADLQEMACVDRGMYTLMGDHKLLLAALAGGDLPFFQDLISWMLEVSRGYAVKLVNPGAATLWKASQPAPGLDDPIGIKNLTQRKIISAFVKAVNALGLPHPVHIHAARLGQPGNHKELIKTIRALEGQRAHLCHVQFFAYGATADGGYSSAADKVVKALEPFSSLTLDVGQVIPGLAMAITADTAALDALRKMTHSPWHSEQFEGEGGINTLPLEYAEKDPTTAIQWATGLELLLDFPDPMRIFLTTDHPNGGSFLAYPQAIEWLMSKPARDSMQARLHPAGKRFTGLSACAREYTLSEIVAITSCGPAVALGLSDRGHLGAGALADIRCYPLQPGLHAMFSRPAWVMRRGQVAVRDGALLDPVPGEVLVVQPLWDPERKGQIHREFHKWFTVQPERYGLGENGSINNQREVPCGSKG